MSWVITGSQKVNWDPSLTTTSLWLDATANETVFSDAGTTQATNGGTVQQWKDKKNNGLIFSQATSGNRPSYNTSAINSKAGVSFTTGKFLAGTRPFAGTGALFFVQQVPSDTEYIWIGANTSSPYLYVAQSGDAQSFTASVGTPTFWANGVINSWSTRNDIWAGLGANAVLLSVTNADLASFTGEMRISGYQNNSNIFSISDGFMSEIIAISGTVQTFERQRVEGYLAHKWGLTANLPSNHPYKVNPPAP